MRFINTCLAVGLAAFSARVVSAVPYQEAQQALTDKCIKHTDDVHHLWDNEVCILAAVGEDVRSRPIATFLYENFGGAHAPAAIDLERPSDEVVARLAYGVVGDDITEQSWVDAFYGALSDLGGPYPEDSFLVRKQYARLAFWTGECDGVPAFNFKDYLQYSDTVEGSYCPQQAAIQSAGPTAVAVRAPRMIPEDLSGTVA